MKIIATILFSAAGAAVGAGFGGTLLGLSGAVVGGAVGTSMGRAIDQRLLGGGSDAVEVGRLDRFQIMGASAGASIPRVWGRIRVPGQVIWASPFKENRVRSGGKGMPSPRVTKYSYSVSLALALCEGEILGVGRIWADGDEIKPKSLNLKVYKGTDQQLPDPTVEAFEGPDKAPAYRGIAYVVIEDLDLGPFGNRVPQLSFEVMRRAQGAMADTIPDLQDAIRGVALIPGTGEYALATRKIDVERSVSVFRTVNVNAPTGDPDLLTSLSQLDRELPNCNAVSLVVSWFGDDLRCSKCNVQPKVESNKSSAHLKPWRSGGIDRTSAQEIPKIDGRSLYGGTPSDSSVIDAIVALRDLGKDVMFYPFVLMEQLSGNQLPNPYILGEIGQSVLPWRGRITLSVAPGLEGTPDLSELAEQEVSDFFGDASGGDFDVVDGEIFFKGSPRWGYRRFILHYAHLCKIAGGVEAFCIGSELRGITQIRGANHTFPAVDQLIDLAADVREILGPDVKISYAADWSEYFGYHVQDNVYFHLDSLWASPNVDFVGIDNYMPISDWRDSLNHADAKWGSVQNLDYLKSNIIGGEGYDWFYDSWEARVSQVRSPIVDALIGEHWIYKPKDLLSWWSNLHHERRGGVRSGEPSAWIPASKPIRFTEYGCPAIDKGTNQPNVFGDERSSEGGAPYFSTSIRDDAIQAQYFRSQYLFWGDSANNPPSTEYSGVMVDVAHCYAWVWDARPFPEFPRNLDLWGDGLNYYTGHWINGRATSVPISRLLTEICEESGVAAIDVNEAYGIFPGFSCQSTESARAIIQSICLTSELDSHEKFGKIFFKSDDVSEVFELSHDLLVSERDSQTHIERVIGACSERIDRLRLSYYDSDGSYAISVAEAVDCEVRSGVVSDLEYPIVLNEATSKRLVNIWLNRSNSAQARISFDLPLSNLELIPSCIVRIGDEVFKVDECSVGEGLSVQATRYELSSSEISVVSADSEGWKPHSEGGRISHVWLDLPLISDAQLAFAPLLAVTAWPWLEPVALWDAPTDSDYRLNKVIESGSVIGRSLTALGGSISGIKDRAEPLLIEVSQVVVESLSISSFLEYGNLVAIGDGSPSNWELFGFKDVELVAPNVISVSTRLRGLLGTEISASQGWPAGSVIVFIDSSLVQPDLRLEQRGLTRNYRLGRLSDSVTSEDTLHDIISFDGVGLRPYSVVHLRKFENLDGSHVITWVPRARSGGDSWEGFDVPLAESVELYVVKILGRDDVLVRTAFVDRARFDYSYLEQDLDTVIGGYTIIVMQVSQLFGPGAPSKLWVN